MEMASEPICRTGQIVTVKVLEVDEKRKRIALTMRLTDAAEKPAAGPDAQRKPRDTRGPNKAAGGKPNRAPSAAMGGAMAAAFSKLKG